MGVETTGMPDTSELAVVCGFYGKEAMAGARELLVARLIDHFSGDIHSVKQVELLEKFLKSKESEKLLV